MTLLSFYNKKLSAAVKSLTKRSSLLRCLNAGHLIKKPVKKEMTNNRIFSFFTPKENKFFPMINNIGALIKDSADTLLEFITCSNKEQMNSLCLKIKDLERQSDSVVKQIYYELNNTFITPFDREDIQLLCERLDDVLDSINSSSKRVLLFQPKFIPKEIVDMCRIIVEACEAIVTALDGLKAINKKADAIRVQCRVLHDLESRGDELYEEYVKKLFENEKDGVELVKMQGIMQGLESTTDMTYSVGKTIRTILVKYA